VKILVYGAGVIGSYLAYELNKAGHDVTIRARGARYQDLKEKGLIIRHYVQIKTTVTPIKVVDNFGENDYYDAVFVVMQRTQIDSVIPSLSLNKKCKLYVLVGNNPTANETYEKIQENSIVRKAVLFAFQESGGRRENGKVISIHFSKTSFYVDALNGDTSYRTVIKNIFASTNFKLYHSSNMDAWLKSHVAVIVPIVYVTYWAKGDLKKVAKNREMLNLTIDAIAEGYEVVKACGYTIEPQKDEDYVKTKRRQFYWMLKIMAATPFGRLAASDHAMSAIGEMNCLSDEFDKLKKRAALSTPNWDRLEQYLIKA
jgi:2-dehydropantoate 2-reductase